ncbi:hypothetical protein HF1_10630 [Mycoplasma haemofelis str. Langford 1]|uniref:Uncharacterized protein n=1 Tax=Mycoplasma haemofelis (strain Langford 1) TaxID=941640 RepID=E8ZIV0_MYCHL|nr:hypothetical protein [Mycoplasma haemofelis]CBY93071.1 hypothetical protein HF1_10630 [Mycoplasma haemofelis str. Langford 1]
MASFLIKTASLAGLASVGGGVAAGTSAWLNPKEKPVEKPKTKDPTEEKQEIPESQSDDTETSTPSPTQQTCIIYEAKDPGGTKNHRSFSQLLGRYEGTEKFFAAFSSSSNKQVSSESQDEIGKACRGEGDKKNVKGRVYLWWGTVGSKNTWIYASDLHKDNDDWENNEEVKKNSTEVLKATQG